MAKTIPLHFLYSREGLLLATMHCAYTYGTTKTEQITIIKKYKYTTNGFTNFIIIGSTIVYGL